MKRNSELPKRIGCLGWGLRILSAGIIVLMILLAIGFNYQHQTTAADFQQFPAPGQLVDVGGYRMHIYCQGEGSPTVIVDSGLGDFSLSWSRVQPDVAQFSRICTYDRAGYGWSDPSSAPRTAQQIALELHTLLDKANIEGPYIMVGHSLGGAHVRMVANLYPEEVVGMVLVDAMHEDFQTGDPQLYQGQQQLSAQWGVMKVMAQFGMLRMMGKSAGEQSLPAYIKQLPADKQEMYMILNSHPAFFETALGEWQVVGESCEQVRGIGKLGDLPLVVLTAGNDLQSTRQSLQDELASLSTNSTHVIAEGSGHFIQLDRPELVIAAVQQVVDQSSTRTP